MKERERENNACERERYCKNNASERENDSAYERENDNSARTTRARENDIAIL